MLMCLGISPQLISKPRLHVSVIYLQASWQVIMHFWLLGVEGDSRKFGGIHKVLVK